MVKAKVLADGLFLVSGCASHLNLFIVSRDGYQSIKTDAVNLFAMIYVLLPFAKKNIRVTTTLILSDVYPKRGVDSILTKAGLTRTHERRRGGIG